MLIFRVLILLALVRLLIVSNKPLWCSSIYATIVFAAGLFSSSIVASLIEGCVAFALATVYFWLLHRFDGSFLWWGILILGPLIGLV